VQTMASGSRKISQPGRRSRRRRTAAPHPYYDEDEFTEEVLVLLRNLEFIISKANQAGGQAFKEMTLREFRDLAAGSKSRIKNKAKTFLENLRRGNREERRQFLTFHGARYLLRNPENEELARDLHLHDLAEETIRKRQDEDERIQNLLSTDPECQRLAAAARCSSSSSLVGASSSSVMDDFAGAGAGGGFSREDIERGVQQVLLEEVLPEQIGRIKLTEDQLDILSRAEVITPKFSFRRLLSHFAMWKNTPLMTMTDLLKLLCANQCEIDYDTLPETADTLLKISDELLSRTKIRSIKTPSVPGRQAIVTAEYLHLGIEHALMGRSAGVIDRWHYLNTMRTVVSLFPEMVPPEIREAVGPQLGEEYDVGLRKRWLSLPEVDPQMHRELVLLLHGHIDGVDWYKNTNKSKGVPILGRLVGIRDDASGASIKTPNLKPFVVGAMKLARATNTKDFVEDFVHELAKLANPARSGLSFKVQLVCMVCDTPQRAECKGTVGHSGYYACERCVTHGQHIEESRKFPQIDALPRTDANWDTYKGTHRHADVLKGPMFEDKTGKVLYEFPYVSGFPLESMHMVDGGVFKHVHEFFLKLCDKVPIDPADPKSKTYSISDSDIEDRIKFLDQYKLTEQARALRLV